MAARRREHGPEGARALTAPASTTTRAPSPAGRRVGIGLAVVLGAVLVLNLLAGGIDRAVGGHEPSGVPGSSYGTQATGLAGLTQLFARYGHPVSRVRGEVTGDTLDPGSTAFVIEPATLTTAEIAELLRFVTDGGRLVVGGSDPFYVKQLRDGAPDWSPDGVRTYGQIDPTLGNVRVVETEGRGSWDDPGSGRVVASEGRFILATADRAGAGTLFFLADVSPLENGHLARADNAAFGLGLAGAEGRPVVFVEGVHGFGARRGLSALPDAWKVALALAVVAAAAFAWSRGRRFGPPDRPRRDLPPARAEYVRALAVTLERTHDPEHALAPMQQWARDRIARVSHLPPDATAEQLDRAAIALGCTEAERGAIWHPAADDDAALALGHLVARLSQHDGSSR
jgi:hypothetical protein